MLLYPKQNGFVIIIVLIFMQIFILLNWYAINDVLLLNKFSKNVSNHDFLFYQAKKILSEKESDISIKLPACMISFIESGELVEKPLDWWKAKSCSGNFKTFKYYYVVEPLAIDTCASIEHVEQATAEYFRMTLFLFSTIDDTRLFLQSTLVRPRVSAISPVCTGERHQVQAGRQSWREWVY